MARILVTGGAGFLGSHFCEHLLARGDEVVALDNFATSDGSNIEALRDNSRFTFVEADVVEELPVRGPLDVVAHLASPASPPEYLKLPLETLRVGSTGTERCLELCRRAGARFLLASTSEVYGDPQVHPQAEAYWGNVNPIGVRSVYDEAKRYAEALTMAYSRIGLVDVGIVRIFNTYGPRLRPGDGRVVSNFLVQALTGEPLTIYGTGLQTRSFCFVDDLVRGLCAMADARGVTGPVNLGNPIEVTIEDLAGRVQRVTGSTSGVVRLPGPTDDPARRRPDITMARRLLEWEPLVDLDDGLRRSAEWFAGQLGRSGLVPMREKP